jgi:nucleoporin NUP159
MSIATQKGLLAAAGPDAVVVAKTDSIRKAFEQLKVGDSNIRPFTPELTLPMPMRISQVAFSSDDQYLVISAETGGGLAVYSVDSLLQGGTQSAFEMSTDGKSVRAVVPNPSSDRGELMAVVTTDGHAMMANLKEKSFVAGPTGPTLLQNVSCVSWSARGKQLVYGLGDGTAVQMTPEGVRKAEIPRPPNVGAENNGMF